MGRILCAALLCAGCYESRVVELSVDPPPGCGDACGLPDVWGDCTAYGRSGGEIGDDCNPTTFEAVCEVVRDGCQQIVECNGVVELVGESCGSTRPPLCPTHIPPPPGRRECTEDAQCGRTGPCLVRRQSDECPPPTCVSDAECPVGTECVFVSAGTGCDPVTICGPPCRDGGCPSDSTCWDGVCQAFFCDEGFACPPDQACGPGVEADVHGCVRQTCMTDFGCSCGACVNGRCASGPGFCAS